MAKRMGEGRSGGVDISGRVGNVHGNIVGGSLVGGNQNIGGPTIAALDGAFLPLAEAISAGPDRTRAEATVKLAALKQEAAKGDDADDSTMAKLADGLVGLVPKAADALVSAFATPILGGIAGPITGFVLDKLRGQ